MSYVSCTHLCLPSTSGIHLSRVRGADLKCICPPALITQPDALTSVGDAMRKLRAIKARFPSHTFSFPQHPTNRIQSKPRSLRERQTHIRASIKLAGKSLPSYAARPFGLGLRAPRCCPPALAPVPRTVRGKAPLCWCALAAAPLARPRAHRQQQQQHRKPPPPAAKPAKPKRAHQIDTVFVADVLLRITLRQQ